MHIRQENHQDFKAVDTVIQQAFKSAEHSDGNEQNLVSRLRKTSAFIPELSLVPKKTITSSVISCSQKCKSDKQPNSHWRRWPFYPIIKGTESAAH